MKKILSITGLLLAWGTLSACQMTPLPLSNSINTSLVSAQRVQQALLSTRSDKVLDAVSKHMISSYFHQMDADRNGVLTPSEIGSMPFQGSDTDKDGRITFEEFMKFDFSSIPMAPTRNALRTMAQSKWDQLNTDKNGFLIFEEVLQDFPDFSSPYPGSGYGDSYPDPGSGYGDLGYNATYNGGLPPSSQPPKFDIAAAKSFFNLTDLNLDRRLTFSEYEDGLARKLMN